MRKIPKYLFDSIDASERILLFTHTRPDGDALGSMFGMAGVLRRMGKDVTCFLEEEIPAMYQFFIPDEPVVIGNSYFDENPLQSGWFGIALDCGSLDRLGIFADIFLDIDTTFVIDHHKSHKSFGDEQWVAPQVSSTGEMVFEIATVLGVEIDSATALCLYVAICTDTGGFRFECTSARTHAIAGALLECGVRPDHVGVHLYDNWTLPRLQLMEMVLSTLVVSKDGQIASVYVDQEMLNKSGACMTDTDGFVDYPRSLSGVKVAVFLKESGEDWISISMRAKGECDVSFVAGQFGGGGHPNAAGFRINNSSVEEARQYVLHALEKALS